MECTRFCRSTDLHVNAGDRDLLATSDHIDGDRRAGGERRVEQLVGIGAEVASARLCVDVEHDSVGADGGHGAERIGMVFHGCSAGHGLAPCHEFRQSEGGHGRTDPVTFRFLLPPLFPATLVHRRDRFFADADLDSGERVVAHCVNTGRMEGLTKPGRRIWLSKPPPRVPPRKLAYTWELIELSSGLIGTNTAIPNAFVGAVLAAGLLPGLGHVKCTPEAPLGILRNSRSSRSDFLLETVEGTRIWVEVKNNHLVYRDGFAYFPDSVSERATEHLEALATKVAAGDRAVVVFLVQRGDATGVRPSDVHDPAFAAAARRVAALGVEFRALAAVPEVTVEAAHLRLIGEIPVDLAPYPTAPVAAFQASLRAEAPAWVRGARKIADTGDAGRAARSPKRPKST